MKLKDLLNYISKNATVRIVVDYKWILDTSIINTEVLKPYNNCYVDRIGIDSDKFIIVLLSENGGIS